MARRGTFWPTPEVTRPSHATARWSSCMTRLSSRPITSWARPPFSAPRRIASRRSDADRNLRLRPAFRLGRPRLMDDERFSQDPCPACRKLPEGCDGQDAHGHVAADRACGAATAPAGQLRLPRGLEPEDGLRHAGGLSAAFELDDGARRDLQTAGDFPTSVRVAVSRILPPTGSGAGKR